MLFSFKFEFAKILIIFLFTKIKKIFIFYTVDYQSFVRKNYFRC